jgi:hypothetical protein
MLPDKERFHAPVPFRALWYKAITSHANRRAPFAFTPDGQVVDLETRTVLSQFLDFMWSLTFEIDRGRVDMRLWISDDAFAHLLGKDSCVLTKLKSQLCKISGSAISSKIGLRMTKGPSHACINFHCCSDRDVVGTVQVTLNERDEFNGGRPVIFYRNSLIELNPSAGSVCQFSNRVLHATTALTQGVCKNLFLVNQKCGHGDKDVLCVEIPHVAAFLNARKSMFHDKKN